VSVSLGSARRDKVVHAEFLGVPFVIERRGTNGDLQAAAELIASLDGQVAAIGLGGIDLYLVAGERRYVVRDALRLARQAPRTPVVDGSGLKNTLERETIRRLWGEGQLVAADDSGRLFIIIGLQLRAGLRLFSTLKEQTPASTGLWWGMLGIAAGGALGLALHTLHFEPTQLALIGGLSSLLGGWAVVARHIAGQRQILLVGTAVLMMLTGWLIAAAWLLEGATRALKLP
jgi:hypothetical protein